MQVFFYSTGVFKDAGIPDDMIQYAVVCTGAINVLMTIVSVSGQLSNMISMSNMISIRNINRDFFVGDWIVSVT
jgi:hypothetical protein